MKAKLKTLEVILLSIVIVLNAYLIYLNINVSEYKATREYDSTANYIQIGDTNLIGLFSKEDDAELITIEEEVVTPVVYDGKTLDEISITIENNLNSTIKGKGNLITSYSIEKGVDPYMATAIILQETGCKWECSYLVRECNNVGGQKGSGCGAYSYFNSLDEGIKAFIDNLYNNYISYGLTTPEEINPKYAEDPNWSKNVNKYIEIIKEQ